MKRVKAACICQTLHFLLKEDIGHAYAVKRVNEEVAQYKAELEKKHVKFKLVDESAQPDGSVILKVIRQYNQNDVGDYLN